MPIDRPKLEAAINASGGELQPDDQVAALLAKLNFLEAKGRYGGLLRSIRASNNKWNFRASLLEVTFAHQFETTPIDTAQKALIGWACRPGRALRLRLRRAPTSFLWPVTAVRVRYPLARCGTPQAHRPSGCKAWAKARLAAS